MYIYLYTRMRTFCGKWKKPDDNKILWGCRGSLLILWWWDRKLVQPPVKIDVEGPQNLKQRHCLTLLHHSCTYLKELKYNTEVPAATHVHCGARHYSQAKNQPRRLLNSLLCFSDKRSNQKQLGEQRVTGLIRHNHSLSLVKTKAGTQAGAEAGTTEENWLLLPFFPLVPRFAFLYIPRPPPRAITTHSKLGPPYQPLAERMLHRLAHRPVWWEQFPQPTW